MTQHPASNIPNTISGSISRRAGLAALAALGLPLGAMLAPGTAAAAPGDSFDDIDILLPLDNLPLFPVVPAPVPPIPIPFPVGPPTPGVPGPDDGPGTPFELPELDFQFDLVPFDPSDLVLPTGPGDDEDPVDDDDDAEPECVEYAAANFDVEVERYDTDLIEVKLMYSDMDVCDFTVWTAIADPGAADTLGETTVGMESVAFATDSADYYQQTFSDYDLCDLEIRVAVEESLSFMLPHTDPGCATPGEDEIPGDDGDDTPDDGDDTPEEARPFGEPETPGTPSGGLPQTGTDLTTVMLALGLMTVGAGSIIALATRQREDLPTA